MNSKEKPSLRPSKDEYFLEIATVVAKRSTCIRRSVGCVLVSEEGTILSTGYNGTPRLAPHCTDAPCAGASYDSGMGLDHCASIHAEQNALAQCADPTRIHAAYMTTSPCMSCMKLLLASTCQIIIAPERYDALALILWINNGRKFKLFNC